MTNWSMDFNFLNTDSYEYVGIGCSCDTGSTVRCGFIFTNIFIGNYISTFDSKPLVQRLMNVTTCAANTQANLF